METSAKTATTRFPRRTDDNHHSNSSNSSTQQQQQQVLIQLGDCLKKATDLGENYNAKGDLIFQAPCGEVSYSEENNGWCVRHNNNGTIAIVSRTLLGESSSTTTTATATKSHPPLELLQSILMAQELCFMLDRANSTKDNNNSRPKRCLCQPRTGPLIDVTDLLSSSSSYESHQHHPDSEAQSLLLTKVSKTAALDELWEVEEYQGWSIQKQYSEQQQQQQQQQLLSNNKNSISSSGSRNSLSSSSSSNNNNNEEMTQSQSASSSSLSSTTSGALSSAAESNWGVVYQLLAGVKGYIASLQQHQQQQGGSDEKKETDDGGSPLVSKSQPKAKRRKLAHVSFAAKSNSAPEKPQEEEEGGSAVAASDQQQQRRRLRSADHNNDNNNNQEEPNHNNNNVRVVSPPALELSSESDITTDDEQHHKEEEEEEEEKHASDDEDYKESDTSGRDEDDDEIFASETVRESAAQVAQQQNQQQHYQTRRAAAAKPSQSATEHLATSSRGTRKRGREESTSPKDWKLADGPPRLLVRLKGRGLRSSSEVLEALIGKAGIPERRQTRRSHGIHIEAPKRFIEVDSNEGWPSSFSHHVEDNMASSPQPAEMLLRQEAKKGRSSHAQSRKTWAKEESSPTRRSHRTRTCRSDSYEERHEDEIDEMEEAVIQAEEEEEDDDDEEESRIPFVLDKSNQLSAARLVSEYEEHSVKQHGLCSSLKGFHGDDFSANDAVLGLLEECEDLNSKYNYSEEDEDIVAERQLFGRSLRVIQGRMNQEIIVRMKEKEQAELLAIEMAYQRKNKKKHAMTISEMEWEEIQDRPVQFEPLNSRSKSRSNGSTSCPCAPKSTRSRGSAASLNTAEEGAPCPLCLNPDEGGDSKPQAVVQNKNMVPLFRTIDVDAPDFVDRDLDDEGLEKKKASEKESKPTRKTRDSNRLRNDHRARQETTQKLYEMKHSIEFMEQYNSGLITEKLKECRK